MNRRLPDAFVAALDHDFHDLLATGGFTQCAALPQEASETEILDLPRLRFATKRNHFGRLRQLINHINSLPAEAE